MLNFSNKSISDVENIVNQKYFKKILIISGSKSYKDSGAKIFIEKIINNKKFFLFLKKNKYPELNELKKIILSIKSIKPDLVIAIGGGSVIDYAKIASSINLSKDLNQRIINSSCKIKKNVKVLAIPTTAGSGAEVTSNAVIYIGKLKYSVEHELIKPDYFALVPELIFNSKKIIKSSAGFDAISQAIESIISKKSNNESVWLASKSLKISTKYFIKHLKNINYENTYKMCLAANYSGKAISISRTTAPHAVSYPFTSYFGISHGHAVSLTLNNFLKFNYENMKYSNCNFNLKNRFKKIFESTNTSNINDLLVFLDKIKKDSNLESNFKKLGIDIKKDYQKIIQNTNEQRLSNNPIKITKDDIKNILIK